VYSVISSALYLFQEGITFPSADRQIALCRSVCAEYAIDAGAVRYVEAHGTGTTVGDRQVQCTSSIAPAPALSLVVI
jgi:acyl transferase domain-containing protein